MLALLIYDWLLCIGDEVMFVWNWHSRATGSWLVYTFSRYAVLVSNILSILTTYPMSDLVRILFYSFNPPILMASIEVIDGRQLHVYRFMLMFTARVELYRGRMVFNNCNDTGHDCIQWCVQITSLEASIHLTRLCSSFLCAACVRPVEQECMVGGHNRRFGTIIAGDNHSEFH